MHANIRIGETQVMASDGCPEEQSDFKNFSLSLVSRLSRRSATVKLVRRQRARTGDFFKKIRILRIPRKLL